MLRRKRPRRTCDEKHANYRSYKEALNKDFNGRCGYCDITEHVIGKVFQIDHFAPKDKFGDLETEYSNLVYACPSCNRSKWNDWPMTTHSPSHDGSKGYVDPCNEEYDEHLERTGCGTIVGKTPVGVYMRHKLKLHALKHKYLWLLDIAYHQCIAIDQFLDTVDQSDPDVKVLVEKYVELSRHYFKYHQIIEEHK